MFFRKKLDLELAIREIKRIKDTSEKTDTLQDIKNRYIAAREACVRALKLYIKWPQLPKHKQDAIDLINKLQGITDNEEISKIVRQATCRLDSDYNNFRGQDYSQVSMVETKPKNREDIQSNTIVLLKDAKKLQAYWIEHGRMHHQSLSISNVQTIVPRLPVVGGNSMNADLITDLAYKYGCGLGGDKPPGRYFQIVTAISNKIARLSPLHYEKGKEEKENKKNQCR